MRNRSFVWSSLLAALVLLAPSCRHKRPPLPPQVVPPATTTTAPPTDTGERVPPPEADFPKEPVPEVLTDDIDELNRTAQERGWIRDAMFAFDASTLDDAAQQALRDSAMWLRAHPEYGLRVEGHCDERGTEQYNLALGDRRASTAAQFLQASGVDAARIRTVSYGEERPFEEGHDEASWAQNRRAHLVLVR